MYRNIDYLSVYLLQQAQCRDLSERESAMQADLEQQARDEAYTRIPIHMYMYASVYMCVLYIYIYTYIHTYIYIYLFI